MTRISDHNAATSETTIALRNITMGEMLRQSATQFPQRKALAWLEGDIERTLTYVEMLAHAERVAYWLSQHAQPGDRISVWSRNSVEWAICEFGCALGGMILAAWNPGWTDRECRHALDLVTPKLVLVGQDTRGESLIERARQLCRDTAQATQVYPLDDLLILAAEAPLCTLPTPKPEEPFLIQFTSGTTGRAKGATLSHFAVANSGWIRTQLAQADETDVYVNPSPLNHVGGAVSMLPGPISTGACYVVMNRFDSAEYIRLIKHFGATRIGGVPTVLMSIIEHPDFDASEYQLRSIGCGGSTVPQPLIERLQRDLGCPVMNTFGQSEHPLIASTVIEDSVACVAETVGRALPHVEIEIRAIDSDTVLPAGEVGEICARSPYRMLGYWAAQEATDKTIDAQGFLHTGDLGTLDEAGYLRVVGRVRDVIIRGGENIYPAEVEDALLSHPCVAGAAVVAVPDKKLGQVVGAAVILRAGEAPATEDLQTFVAEQISYFKVPQHWLVVSEFPLTPSGKISKIQLEEQFANQVINGV